MDRISTSSQNQLVGEGGRSIPHDARSLSEVERTLKSLNGYHENILEALRTAATAANTSSHRGSNASSGVPHTPGGGAAGAAGGFGVHRSSTTSLTDELRKQMAAAATAAAMASNDSYLDYGGRGRGADLAASAELVAAMAATLKRSSREKLDNVQSQQQSASQGVELDGGGAGPIRIRNLEDLIRQLEHSSRHMSPSGSEDIRETEAERHFR